MKKIVILFFLILLVLIAGGIFITKKINSIKQKDSNQDTISRNTNDVNNSIKKDSTIQDSISRNSVAVNDSINQNSPSKDSIVVNAIIKSKTIKDSIPSNWKTYTNNKLGITFQYPKTWTKYGEESNVINNSGTLVAIEFYLNDTASQTTLLIKYYLAPNGINIYQFAISQFNSSKGLFAKNRERINVGGSKAIKGSVTMKVDGKGHSLNPPLRLIVVDFLDKQQTGAIELQFKTPLPGENIEVTKFRQLLSTFKFTNSGSN